LATSGRHVSRFQLLDTNGNPVAAESTATIELLDQEGPACSDIVGRVFEDADRNGVADRDERGVSGVSILVDSVERAKTDSFGRYVIHCLDIAGAGPGMTIVLSADPQTLPAGFRLSSPERVVTLTSQ